MIIFFKECKCFHERIKVNLKGLFSFLINEPKYYERLEGLRNCLLGIATGVGSKMMVESEEEKGLCHFFEKIKCIVLKTKVHGAKYKCDFYYPSDKKHRDRKHDRMDDDWKPGDG